MNNLYRQNKQHEEAARMKLVNWEKLRVMIIGAGIFVRGHVIPMLDQAGQHYSVALFQRKRDGRYDGFKQHREYELELVDLKGTVRSSQIRSIGAWYYTDEPDHWKSALELAKRNTMEVLITNTGEDTFQFTPEQAKAKKYINHRSGAMPTNPKFFIGQLLCMLYWRWKNGGGRLFVQPAELLVKNGDLLQFYILQLAKAWIGEMKKFEDFQLYLLRDVRFCRTLVDRLTPEANITPKKGDSSDKPGLRAEAYGLYVVEREAGEPWFVDHLQVLNVPKGTVKLYSKRKIVLVNALRSLMVQEALRRGWEDKLHLPFSRLMEDRGMREFCNEILYDELLPAVADTPDAEAFALHALERFGVEQVSSRIEKVMGGNLEGHLKKLAIRSKQAIFYYEKRMGGRMPRRLLETLRSAQLDGSVLLREEADERKKLKWAQMRYAKLVKS